MACGLLVVAAFHPELAPLRTVLRSDLGGLRGQVAGQDVAAGVVGIGLPMAAVGMAMHLSDLHPQRVLLVGTCGAYPGSGLRIGEVVTPDRIHLVDSAALEGRSQFPEPMSLVLKAHGPTVRALAQAGAKGGDVATTLAITVSDPMAEGIARGTGCCAEHLEAYGVATACAARGTPCAMAFGVANMVGSNARDEWRVHHRQAASAAIEVVLRSLH